MTTRKYSSRSQQTTLTGSISSTATSVAVVSVSALLGGVTISAGQTFTVVIDPDTALEEIVDVTATGSSTLTITRGVDGSTGQEHSAGAVVRHMAIGRDYREANTHIEKSAANAGESAHGIQLDTVVLTSQTGTVTGGMIATGAVGSTKIDNAAVVEAKIGTGAVTTTKIADVNVTTAKIADLNVTTGKIADSAITSAKIADGTIVDGDINSAAAIAKTKISGTAITAADTGTVTSTMIADGTIVNGDISTSAQVAYSKLNLTNSVTNADINASAAIDWTKIAPSSTVSATELGYLDGVTSAVQTQIDSKLSTTTAASTYAPLASPALTGTPTAPTATAGTNTTQVATTAFVKTAVDNVVASAPGALDTLNELAAAMGNDANFSTTVTNSIATKLPLAGGTMTGAIAMGTNKITGVGNPTLAQDAATKNYVDTVVIAPTNLTGPITSVGNATAIASQTGTGSKIVVDTSPTLVTPELGVATATSINGTPIPTSKTLVATDSTAYVVPSQSGNSGKYLKTDGSVASWSTIAGAIADPTEPASPQDGLVWVDTDGTAPTTVVTRWSKNNLAAGITALSGNDDNSLPLSYTAGYEQVFLNGAMLSRGNDYTATSGTSITLTNGTASGDIIEVVSAKQIAVTDTYTQTQANSLFALNTNSIVAGKNAVINGGFDVWQRGTSIVPSSGYAYTADRWICGRSTGTTTTTSRQSSGLTGFNYCMRVQRNSGDTATTGIYALTGFETADSLKFAGQTIVVSFYARAGANYSNSGSSLLGHAYTGTGTDQNPWSGLTGLTDVGNKTVTLTTSWQRFSFTATPGSTATQLMIQFDFTPTGTAGAADYFEITGVQLELGSNATAFSRAGGTIQGELAACQRYYFKSYNQATAPGTATDVGFYQNSIGTDSSGFPIVTIQFPVTMRTAPTVTPYSEAGVSGQWYYKFSGGSTTATNATASPISDTRTRIISSVGLGSSFALCQWGGHIVASAEL